MRVKHICYNTSNRIICVSIFFRGTPVAVNHDLDFFFIDQRSNTDHIKAMPIQMLQPIANQCSVILRWIEKNIEKYAEKGTFIL